MNFLPKSDYMDDAPSGQEDSPTRIDHDNCQAGADTKGRLYIWRQANGAVSAYCHHCGLKGYTMGLKNALPNMYRLRTKRKAPRYDEVYLPKGIVLDVTKWPVEARAWLYAAGLTDEEITKYGFGYSPYGRRVIVPCYNENNILIGYQSRRIYDDGLPKYFTKTRKGSTLMFVSDIDIPVKLPDTVVIVEDSLSCAVVGRTHKAVALMGCSLDDKGLLYLTQRYKNAIIFLDNDNSDVKKKQTKLRKELELVMNNVSMIKYHCDPKEASAIELAGLLP